MFSKKECQMWRNRKTKKIQCCSNPNIQHFSVQERRGDEMSTHYKICMNCNKKFSTRNQK